MIIVQKFNSLAEVDKEFIAPLEELLAEYIPSFDYLKSFEITSDESTNFSYYLFFSNKTNAPIGFAQANISQSLDKKYSFLQKIRGKSNLSKEKSITWAIPGSIKEGFIFNPIYKESACIRAQKVISEFCERDDIESQTIYFSEAFEEISNHGPVNKKSKKRFHTPHLLLKNKSSYQSFVQELPQPTAELVQRSWKVTQKELGYHIGDYTQFKEVFAYKANGARQYKELKKRAEIKKIIDLEQEHLYLTLETKEEVKALIILIKGQSSHYFYDSFIFDHNIAEVIPHQLAIMKFYEAESAERLHYLGRNFNEGHFKELGFTFRPGLSAQAKQSNRAK